MFSQPTWQIARDSKIADRTASIERIKLIIGLESESDLSILSSTANGIVENIKLKVWTATLVLKAYIRRAIAVQEMCNPLTEIMFDSALEQAALLDEEFFRTGTIVGRLHGVPISLKDQYHIKGADSTIGFTHAYNKPSENDAALVTIIKKEGAIPFCKTNVPQTMLSFECGNPLFGFSSNPYDSNRTCGGSSGGEAALLAADGSSIGFGSDVGGSLRIPSAYCGNFALKPCYGRFASDGITSSNPGFDSIKSTLGPMARSIEDLELATRIVINASVELARTLPLIPLPFREITLPKKLKFGYYFTDGFVKASPACCRAINGTVEALRREGHECVEFDPPSPFEALEIFVALTSAGGYETLLAGLKGDPRESSLFLTTLGVRLPSLVRSVASTFVESVLGDPKFASILNISRTKSVTETQEWQFKRDVYVQNFREEVWGKLGLDAIICSTQATPALKHGQTWNLSALAIGTILYNVVDTTVGSIPVTFVSKDDVITEAWSEGMKGSKMFEEKVYTEGIYNPIEMEGLPVGIQLVGAAYEEEKVLKMMKVVDEALGTSRGFAPGDFIKRKQKEVEVNSA